MPQNIYGPEDPIDYLNSYFTNAGKQHLTMNPYSSHVPVTDLQKMLGGEKVEEMYGGRDGLMSKISIDKDTGDFMVELKPEAAHAMDSVQQKLVKTVNAEAEAKRVQAQQMAQPSLMESAYSAYDKAEKGYLDFAQKHPGVDYYLQETIGKPFQEAGKRLDNRPGEMIRATGAAAQGIAEGAGNVVGALATAKNLAYSLDYAKKDHDTGMKAEMELKKQRQQEEERRKRDEERERVLKQWEEDKKKFKSSDQNKPPPLPKNYGEAKDNSMFGKTSIMSAASDGHYREPKLGEKYGHINMQDWLKKNPMPDDTGITGKLKKAAWAAKWYAEGQQRMNHGMGVEGYKDAKRNMSLVWALRGLDAAGLGIEKLGDLYRYMNEGTTEEGDPINIPDPSEGLDFEGDDLSAYLAQGD